MLTAQPPARLPAQIVPNRATQYLHPTDATDARAIWLNPAGFAVFRQASVHLDLTVGDPGARGRLRQVTAGFSSRGLGFSYQRDAFDGGVVAHTYRLGLAGAASGFAAGVSAAHYRGGGARATGWDVGAVYLTNPSVTLGAVVANIGEPDVRGVELPLTLVPSATLTAAGPALALSAHGRVARDSVLGYGFGVRWTAGARVPFALLARLDTDGELRRAAFAFGVSIGGQDVVGTIVTTSGDLRTIDAASVYGVSSRPLER